MPLPRSYLPRYLLLIALAIVGVTMFRAMTDDSGDTSCGGG